MVQPIPNLSSLTKNDYFWQNVDAILEDVPVTETSV